MQSVQSVQGQVCRREVPGAEEQRSCLLVLAEVARNGAVRGLALDGAAVGTDEDGGHKAERSVALRDRVAHDVAVVVLRRPDEAAGALHRLRDHVVYQSVLVPDGQSLEVLTVLTAFTQTRTHTLAAKAARLIIRQSAVQRARYIHRDL